MMRFGTYWLTFLILFTRAHLPGQVVYTPADGFMIAQTKQVSQFIRRFNGEETITGKRLNPGDADFRKADLRRAFQTELFDLQNASMGEGLRRKFIQEVNHLASPFFFDFHGGQWFAEVNTRFSWKGREETLILFMEIQQEAVGSKWVMTRAYFPPFADMFKTNFGEDQLAPFLHPLSHELDFMNLDRVFRNRDQVAAYASADFLPDHLSLMLYEIQRGGLTFLGVSDLKIHVFQMPGWYFEIKEFNRSTRNSGWLISQMTEISPAEAGVIRRFIFRQ